MSFFSELKRRGLFPVAVAYTVASWLIVQVADVMLPAFDAPEWVLRSGIILLAIGFPIALIVSWIFELTPEGVKRSEELPAEYSSNNPLNKYIVLFIISVLTAGVILLVFSHVIDSEETTEPFAATPAENQTIAVLPFVNRSLRQEDLFFSEGIHDDLLTRLAKIESFRVTSRTSVMRYRDTLLSIPEIGTELGATAILEGGVQRSGDHVRINVQLIDATTDLHLWAETYDRELTAANLFAIQSEIARAISSALQTALTPDDEKRLEQIPTQNLAAYEAYLRGRQHLFLRNDEDNITQALIEFSESASLDPEFAGAYAGRCEAQLSFYRLGGDTERFRAGKMACEQALSIDPEMIEVRIALARLYRLDGNPDQAIQEALLVLELKPENAAALMELGISYQLQGRTAESEQALIKATEVAPGNWQTYDILAGHYLNHSNNPQAKQRAVSNSLKVIELIPDSASAYNNLGAAYHSLGQYEAANMNWDRALELEPTRTGYTNRGLAFYYDGEFEKAAEMQLKAIELAPSDHRAWGRLAESWRFVDGHQDESLEAYQSAILLAEPMLEIDEQDWKTRGLLSTYYVHAGRTDEALAMVEESLRLSGNQPEALLYHALVMRALGDDESARKSLQEAINQDSNYDLYVRQDPDLANLLR